MKAMKFFLFSIFAIVLPCTAECETILTSGINPVVLLLDGKEINGGWNLLFGDKVDVLETTASEIIFKTDTDSIVLTPGLWQSEDFVIRDSSGQSAPIRVRRVSENPYLDPDPEFIKRGSSALLNRQQAQFDINALVNIISEVHPDMFSECKQVDFFKAVNNALHTLPDSVSTVELYRRIAPIASMLGDGHTNVFFPFNDLFTIELERLPAGLSVGTDRTISCFTCVDSIIPAGSTITSINNISSECLIDTMLPFMSGEREKFKLARLDNSFSALLEMLFPADTFSINFIPEGMSEVQTASLPAMRYHDFINRLPSSQSSQNQSSNQPYSYSIDKKNNVAVMDFKSFADPGYMKLFADSMFKDLKQQKIGNLIIDIRQNGGGNSYVGDILLRYISQEPFVQMDRSMARITPVTKRLMNEPDITPMFVFNSVDPKYFNQPLSDEEGHYNGNIYLLTSSNTFSSASSFAWTFKECGIGKVVGEETGGMNVSYGDIVYYRLPVSGINCSISFKRFWHLRADESNIHGTMPDIPTPADTALEIALKSIKQ